MYVLGLTNEGVSSTVCEVIQAPIKSLFYNRTLLHHSHPPPPPGMLFSLDLIFATTASVVSNVDATLVAFCRALLATLAGSRMPASTISTYCSDRTSNPMPGLLSLTLATTTGLQGLRSQRCSTEDIREP